MTEKIVVNPLNCVGTDIVTITFKRLIKQETPKTANNNVFDLIITRTPLMFEFM